MANKPATTATSTPPPKSMPSASDTGTNATYTANQFKSLYKNMVTTTNGIQAGVTAQQQRTLSGMARMSAKTEVANNASIGRSAGSQRGMFGNYFDSSISQNLQGAKVAARAGRIQDAGNQRAASDLAVGENQAINIYKSADSKALVAAQTGLAEQLKQYNNAVASATGGAKAIIASASQDGQMLNAIYAKSGTLSKADFLNQLTGVTDPSEQALLWNAYGNMQKGQSAGDAFETSARTLYGDQVGNHYLQHIPKGVNSAIFGWARSYLNDHGGTESAAQIQADLLAQGVSQDYIDLLFAAADKVNPGWSTSGNGSDNLPSSGQLGTGYGGGINPDTGQAFHRGR